MSNQSMEIDVIQLSDEESANQQERPLLTIARPLIEEKCYYDEKFNKHYLPVDEVQNVYYYQHSKGMLFKMNDISDDAIDGKIYLNVLSPNAQTEFNRRNDLINSSVRKLVRNNGKPKKFFTLSTELANNQEVFARHESTDMNWQRGRVIEMLPERREVRVELSNHAIIRVPYPCVAYPVPKRDLELTKAYRVVARIAGLNSQIHFLSGRIIEASKPSNHRRYLIYFENGLISYVKHRDISVVVDQSKCNEKFDALSEQFLSFYYQHYPQVPLERFKLNDRCAVRLRLCKQADEDRTDFYIQTSGRVTKVDCKLVQVETQGKHVWLYRGDFTRILSINDRSDLCINPEMKKRKRAARKIGSQRNFIEIILDEDDESVASDQGDEDDETLIEIQTVEEKSVVEVLPAEKKKSSIGASRLLVEKIKAHTCGPHCLRAREREQVCTRGVNMFLLPIVFGGWKRLYQIEYDLVKRIFYLTPCGKKLDHIETIFDYLQQTDSIFQIDQFNLDQAFVIEEDELSGNKYIKYEIDISNGRESYQPVSLINTIDSTEPPAFEYIAKREFSTNVSKNLDTNFLVCCQCTDDCRNSEHCACQLLTKEQASVVHGFAEMPFKNRNLQTKVLSGIYECNDGCACMKNKSRCMNRLVQFGLRHKLQLFKTLKKGWGVRTLHDIPKGSFVCIYSGVILDDQEADQEAQKYNDTYLADLDLIEHVERAKSELFDRRQDFNLDQEEDESEASIYRYRQMYGESEPYVINGDRKGNIGRFINHSCDPNCFAQTVLIDTHDLRHPWIAFFTCRHVPALTELSWDYSYEIVGSRTRIVCHCGSSNCRRRLL